MSTPFLVMVSVRVKPGLAEAFIAATQANAEASRREPGVWQFDLVQSQEDPLRFVLLEGYRTPDAPAAHKATAHYATWRDAVADMMAEARTSTRWTPVGG